MSTQVKPHTCAYPLLPLIMIDGLQCVDLLDIPSLLRLISFDHFKKVVFEKFSQCFFQPVYNLFSC